MADSVENRGPQLLGVNIAFCALAFLTVLLRSYVRVGLVKKFALDDWVMLVALVCPAPRSHLQNGSMGGWTISSYACHC